MIVYRSLMLIIMRDRFLLVNNPACCLLEMMDGVQTAVLSTCISCETGARRHTTCLCALMQHSMCMSACVCVCAWVCVCVRICVCVYVFSQCLVWHIFTEGCVLSLSFGVRPEAMSNWSVHTFRLDSHWHARPWLYSLRHEKGKQCHRNMSSSFLGKKTFDAIYRLFSRLLLPRDV